MWWSDHHRAGRACRLPDNCGPASICALMAGGCAETIMLGDYDLLTRVAIKLKRAQVLDGGEIDRVVFLRDGRVSRW
jgi:hypothetical protein